MRRGQYDNKEIKDLVNKGRIFFFSEIEGVLKLPIQQSVLLQRISVAQGNGNGVSIALGSDSLGKISKINESPRK